MTDFVFVDTAPLVVIAKYSKKRDKQTYNRLQLEADGPYRIISVQQHTLKIDEESVRNTISIDRAALVPSDNRNASIGKERTVIEGEEIVIENEHQAPDREVTDS